jgi:hypothetical protein
MVKPRRFLGTRGTVHSPIPPVTVLSWISGLPFTLKSRCRRSMVALHAPVGVQRGSDLISDHGVSFQGEAPSLKGDVKLDDRSTVGHSTLYRLQVQGRSVSGCLGRGEGGFASRDPPPSSLCAHTGNFARVSEVYAIVERCCPSCKAAFPCARRFGSDAAKGLPLWAPSPALGLSQTVQGKGYPRP